MGQFESTATCSFSIRPDLVTGPLLCTEEERGFKQKEAARRDSSEISAQNRGRAAGGSRLFAARILDYCPSFRRSRQLLFLDFFAPQIAVDSRVLAGFVVAIPEHNAIFFTKFTAGQVIVIGSFFV